MKTTLLYAKIQLLRVLRDPVTLIVLFAIPVLLLVLFGAFLGGGSNISLKVAVVSNSEERFAEEFATQLKQVEVLQVNEDITEMNAAETSLKAKQLDGIVELPAGFGALHEGRPNGTVKVSSDPGNRTSVDILSAVMTSIAERSNAVILGSDPPIKVEGATVQGTASSPVDVLYPMFTAMAIMMVGIFAVASSIPSDKKTGVLRRMRVTPFRTSQLIGGLVLAYLGVAVLVVAVMTAIAMLAFGMEMRGDWLSLGAIVLISSMLMIAMGVMLGGWAKNTTQADIYGQIIFLASLAFSGIWLPRAMMPDWLAGITSYFPLTPIIEGLERIVVEGLSITSIGLQLAIIGGWFVVVFLIGTKTFRWE